LALLSLQKSTKRLAPKMKTSFDVVFLAKKGIIDTDLKKIKTEVKRLFKKAGMVR